MVELKIYRPGLGDQPCKQARNQSSLIESLKQLPVTIASVKADIKTSYS